ncbi:hypothetical protein K435DRAFT_879116 [Dendrothele bispora CBS 962.96]|uniref:Uncharacterized protein n=1 Tax=Dendrothele bispora (strain CBS 962.96) TaxID=1314807 RepID=A0A4S8KMR9_DENBC|nr:hypothetical protein K435DRAFT_879116 [Dendrothele bispora CBS 962.96]
MEEPTTKSAARIRLETEHLIKPGEDLLQFLPRVLRDITKKGMTARPTEAKKIWGLIEVVAEEYEPTVWKELMEGGRKMVVGVEKAMENMNLELGTEGLERMEKMEKALEEIKEKLEVGEVRQTTWADEVDNVIQGARTESYARVVAQQVVKPRHDEALRAAKARDRRLLLKTANQQLWQKTEAELTQLANKALDTILDGSERAKIVGVSKLAGGRGLLMFRTTEEVKWLAENEMLDGMAAAMGENITIRPNVFEVVVEFVPVNVQIETEGEREDIAIDNGMTEGSLIAARWIKPVERRHSKQVVAHAIFQFAVRR